MKKINLNGKWNCQCIDKQLSFSGTVPGSTLNDLVVNGYTCANVFFGENYKAFL